MPSIEIICVGQKTPTDCSFLPFPVEISSELTSHRIPSRFQADFDRMDGYIYHFLDGDGPTAYNLLKKDWYDAEGNDKDSDDNLEFRDEYVKPIEDLFLKLQESSEKGELLVTSDYQFGPESTSKVGPITLSEFWSLHRLGQIILNSSYLIGN